MVGQTGLTKRALISFILEDALVWRRIFWAKYEVRKQYIVITYLLCTDKMQNNSINYTVL